MNLLSMVIIVPTYCFNQREGPLGFAKFPCMRTQTM